MVGAVLMGIALVFGAAPISAQVHPYNAAPTFDPDAPMSPGAIISNGTIMLGVVDQGQLNEGGGTASICGTTGVGMRYEPNNSECTAPGCWCEGWGVADGVTGVFGQANVAAGNINVTDESFVATATTATSVVTVGGDFRVTHDYFPSATPYLYECEVTIENISGVDMADLRYTRAMDWDTEPTPFAEYVTIQGTALATNVLYAHDDGFEPTNPLAARSPIIAEGDFIDSGPADHGALFDFGFGALAAGESHTFSTFYGAAPSEIDALNALATVNAEVYSFGQIDWDGTGDPLAGCNSAPSGTFGASSGTPHTFIFGFAGVGGVVVGGAAVPATSNTGIVVLVLLITVTAVFIIRRRV
jgi:hypothetical protein